MSFSFPSLDDLAARARAAFTSNLSGVDAWLWPNNIGPTAKVIAEGLSDLFGRVATVEKRRFAFSSDWTGLLEHGREYGLTPNPASSSGGMAVLTAPAAVAVVDGAVLQRADGQRYTVSGASALAAAGSLSLTLTAQTPGAGANGLSGQSLSIVSGVSGPGATGAVVTVSPTALAGGTDAEGREAFRARILFRKRFPPAAGTPADYVRWGMAVTGVSAIFVERLWAGPGTVRIFVLGDPSSGNAVPSPSLVEAVRQAIALQAPAGAAVTVIGAVGFPVDVTVSGLMPATTAVREAVLAELRDLFGRRARVAGADTPVAGLPFLATPVSFSRSWVAQAVSAAAGEDRHVLVAPAGDGVQPVGSVAVLGNVLFV